MVVRCVAGPAPPPRGPAAEPQSQPALSRLATRDSRLQPKYPYYAPLTRVPSNVGHETGRRADVGWVVGAHVAREETPVTAEPGVQRDVLFAVRSPKGDRAADDAGAD